MPPSDLVLAPTNPTFTRSLKLLKDLINRTRHSEHGFPDGIRITINAIETDDTPDMQLNSVEHQTSNTVNQYIVYQYKRDYEGGRDDGQEDDLQAEYLIFV